MTDKKKPAIFSHDIDVVGLGFRMKRPLREQLAAKMPLKVSLQREPENKYDRDAIRVDAAQDKGPVTKGQHLGYIRADSAALLAPLMDCREDGGFVFKSGTLIELDADDDHKSGAMTLEFHDYRRLHPTIG